MSYCSMDIYKWIELNNGQFVLHNYVVVQRQYQEHRSHEDTLLGEPAQPSEKKFY